MSAASQFRGASQNSSTAHIARVRSIGASAHHSMPPISVGSSTTGRRIAQGVSPSSQRIAAITQPTIGGWSE